MTLMGNETVVRDYHFDRGGDIGEFTGNSSVSGATAITTAIGTNPSPKGAKCSLTGAADHAFIYGNDVAFFDIDQLAHVEFLIRLESWNANAIGYVGLCSAYNSTPDSIAQSAWLKIAGGSNGRDLAAETDDGTTDLNDKTPTPAIELPQDDWVRLAIDFRTGVQTLSPPSQSTGGKASVQFAASNANGEARRLKLGSHMDMSAYAAGLQPIFGLRQATGTAGTPAMYCRLIRAEYALP